MTTTPTLGRLIVCAGAKGGQGTTTIAAAVALALTRDAATLLVDTTGDTLPLLGLPTAEITGRPVPAAAGLDVVTVDGAAAIDPPAIAEARRRGIHVVIDAGTTRLDLDDADHVLVVRNCYLALRRAVTVPPPFRAVVINEPNRALTVADVAAVLAAPSSRCRGTPPWPGPSTPACSPPASPAASPPLLARLVAVEVRS